MFPSLIPTPTSIFKNLIWFYISTILNIILRPIRRLLGLKEPEGFVEGQINKTARICKAATENVTNIANEAVDMVGQGLKDTQECIGESIASVGNLVEDTVKAADVFHITDSLPNLPFGGSQNHVKPPELLPHKKDDGGLLPSFGLFGGSKDDADDEKEEEKEPESILPSFGLFGNAKEKVVKETKKLVEPEKTQYLPSFGNLFGAAMEKDETEKKAEKIKVVEPEKSSFLPSLGGMFGNVVEKVEEKVDEVEDTPVEKSSAAVGGFLRRRFF